MAIIKAVSSKASVGKAINYVTKKEKTTDKLITGINCSPKTAIDQMKVTKMIWGKTDGRQYKHYVQSFAPGENLTPKTAHEIAKKLCESDSRFEGHEVLIATHRDKDHIHSHFIVNSVNFETGKKIQCGPKDLQAMKDRSDEICREYGLSITKKTNEINATKSGKYKALEKAESDSGYKSYLLECFRAVFRVKKKATSRESFIELMKSDGYAVNWSDTRKYVTFTDNAGNKIRNSNLEKTFQEPLSKGDLENEFTSNFNRTRARTQLEAGDERNGRDNIQTIRDHTGVKSAGNSVTIRKSVATIRESINNAPIRNVRGTIFTDNTDIKPTSQSGGKEADNENSGGRFGRAADERGGVARDVRNGDRLAIGSNIGNESRNTDTGRRSESDDTDAFVRKAKVEISDSRAREANSGTDRANREAERQRLNSERKREADTAKRTAKERERRSYSKRDER